MKHDFKRNDLQVLYVIHHFELNGGENVRNSKLKQMMLPQSMFASHIHDAKESKKASFNSKEYTDHRQARI